MTAKLTAKQAQDFITLAKNATNLLFRDRTDNKISGRINVVEGRASSGQWWELNRATAKKLLALGLIERGTRLRGTWEYMIVITNAGHEELGRHYDLSKPQAPAGELPTGNEVATAATPKELPMGNEPVPAPQAPVAALTKEQKRALAVKAMQRLADMVEFQGELLAGTGLEGVDSRAIAKQLATWVNWIPTGDAWDVRLGEAPSA